jgi:hypothetical protein
VSSYILDVEGIGISRSEEQDDEQSN